MQVVVARARRRCLAVLMFFAYLVLVVVHVVSIAVRDLRLATWSDSSLCAGSHFHPTFVSMVE